MSLNWSVENCKDPNFVLARDADGNDLEDQTEWYVTDSLIWMTLTLGLYSTITEDTAADWYARVSFYEKLNGSWLYSEDEESGARIPRPITPEDIVARIGLHTNGCFKREAWSTFVKRVTRDMESDGRRRFERAIAGAVAS